MTPPPVLRRSRPMRGIAPRQRVRLAVADARIKLTPGNRKQLRHIASILEQHRDTQHAAFAVDPRLWVGIAAPDQLAKLWQRMHFSADEVDEWVTAGCVLPLVAAALRASDITSRQAAEPTDHGDGPPATIAFKCATMKLSISEAKAALGITTS